MVMLRDYNYWEVGNYTKWACAHGPYEFPHCYMTITEGMWDAGGRLRNNLCLDILVFESSQ